MTLMVERLLCRLEQFGRLSLAEKLAIEDAVTAVRRFAPYADICRDDSTFDGVHLVLEGFACRYHTSREGRRQITGYCVPGDLCDARMFVLNWRDHSIGALGPVEAAIFSRQSLQELTERFPGLTRGFWATTLCDESIAREWIINAGHRTALARVAHVLCELYVRLRAVGMAEPDSCDMPLTQHDLGEALALSTVHVNRTLMELRRLKLVTFQNRQVVIHDYSALQTAAGFDPAYLQSNEKLSS